MKRTKLTDRKLPSYTNGEEIFNMVSHIVGGALGIVAITLISIFAGINKDIYGIVSGVIFGLTMVILYTMSSIYHGLKGDSTAKKVFQIIDHCSIFILIAGTYTPVALCAIRERSVFDGWFLFAVIWTLAIIGVTLNSIDLKKYKKFSMVCYLVMGWLIILKIAPLIEIVGMKGFYLLLAGGVAYTIGAIFYAFKKLKWMHSVFHILCVIGSLLHFLFIFFYVIL